MMMSLPLRLFRRCSLVSLQKMLTIPCRSGLSANPIDSHLTRPVIVRSIGYVATRNFKDIKEEDEPVDRPPNVFDQLKKDAWSNVQFDHDYFDRLEQRVIAENNRSYVKFFANIVMLELSYADNLEGAKIFLDFILKTKGQIGLVQRVVFIKILGKHNVDNELDETIFSHYEECVKVNGNVFDRQSLSMFILAFSTTKKWRKSFEFLDSIEQYHAPHFPAYAYIMLAAAKNQDMDVFYSLFERACNKGVTSKYNCRLDNSIQEKNFFSDLLDLAEQKPETVDISVVLTLLEKYCIFPNETMIDRIAACIRRSYHCKIFKTKMSHSGVCQKCKKVLKTSSLNQEEHEILKNEFFKNVLSEGNQKLWTTPSELQAFQKFLAEHGPFDLVVDHSNLLYTKKRIPTQKRILDVLHHFLEEGKKILNLTKAKNEMRYPGTWTFNVDRRSQDDFFMLYAALESGKDALIFSGDFFRDSKYKLGEYSELFIRWQRSRQIVAHKDGFKVFAKKPKTYDPRAQEIDGNLHIPYLPDEEALQHIASFEAPELYLCVQMKN